MKKIIAGVLIAVAAIGLGRVYYMKSQLASRYTLKDLQEIAEDARKSLPLMVDPQTRLTDVVASDHLLEKRFTLVAATASEALRAELADKLLPLLKAQSCQSKVSLNLYNSGVAEAFSYSDRNGNPIATFRIDKDSCK